MKTNPGFDLLAPVYDLLARAVFRKSIIESQTFFLDKIAAGSKVLILGGGTGWILEELEKRNISCTVWYVEISVQMLRKSRKRKIKNPVHFIHGTMDDIPSRLVFDVVIANFYFDMFADQTLPGIIRGISNHTQSSGAWHITDFVRTGVWWHTGMLKIMYAFFRVVCKIEARHLPDWQRHLENHKLVEVHTGKWYKGFIKSGVWHYN